MRTSVLVQFISRIAIYLIVYELVVVIADKPIFPHIGDVFDASVTIFTKYFLSDFIPSLARWAYVYVIGIAIGGGLGLLIGFSNRFRNLLKFDIDYWRSLPATALIPFLFALGGDNEFTRSAPALYITVFTALYFVSKSAENIDYLKIRYLRSLGAGNRFIFFNCYFYEIFPSFMVAAKQAISLSFLVLISCELVIGSSGDRGIGNRLVDWLFYTEFELMIATLLMIGFLGYLSNVLLTNMTKLISEKLYGIKSLIE